MSSKKAYVQFAPGNSFALSPQTKEAGRVKYSRLPDDIRNSLYLLFRWISDTIICEDTFI